MMKLVMLNINNTWKIKRFYRRKKTSKTYRKTKRLNYHKLQNLKAQRPHAVDYLREKIRKNNKLWLSKMLPGLELKTWEKSTLRSQRIDIQMIIILKGLKRERRCWRRWRNKKRNWPRMEREMFQLLENQELQPQMTLLVW